MENQTNSKQDCGCGDGCCTPPKNISPWKKWVFALIILAAVAIATVKLVNQQDAPPEKCCDPSENSKCCPESQTE
jgi:hypothetical protein